MPTRTWTVVLAMLAAPWLGCKSSQQISGHSSIKVQISELKVGTGADGRPKVVFDVNAVNEGSAEETIYLFVAAFNMEPRPPTRGIWPPQAAPELTNSAYELAIGQYQHGFPITLGPRATLETQGEIEVPPGRVVFKNHQLVIFDSQGRKVRDDFY